jgi:hypothetical protein
MREVEVQAVRFSDSSEEFSASPERASLSSVTILSAGAAWSA